MESVLGLLQMIFSIEVPKTQVGDRSETSGTPIDSVWLLYLRISVRHKPKSDCLMDNANKCSYGMGEILWIRSRRPAASDWTDCAALSPATCGV
jgi:hypothetical protein